MIVKIRLYNCHHKTAYAVKSLLLEIKHIVPFIDLCHVGACTVKHNKTEAHDQDNDRYQIEVIVVQFPDFQCFSDFIGKAFFLLC